VSLATQVDALAARIAGEVKSVRAAIAGKSDTGHTHPGLTGPAGADGAPGATGPAGTPGDEVAVYNAGTAPASWVPSASNGSRQRATLASAVTLSGPADPPRDGFRVSFALTATGSSRVLTIDGGIGRLAGWPTSMQCAVGKAVRVRIEWDAALGRWILLTMTQEA
jgi:hypothetical protein